MRPVRLGAGPAARRNVFRVDWHLIRPVYYGATMTRTTIAILVLLSGLGLPALAGPGAPAAEPEPWAVKPPAEWPIIRLTQEGKFETGTVGAGGSAFLIRSLDGRLFA